MSHTFTGRWISNETLARLVPRNVFHRQLDKPDLPCDKYRDQHVIFRKSFSVDTAFERALLYVSADDYYKLYVNGVFVAQGPSPSYHFQYNYNEIDLSAYLHVGDNLIAVHTLYQGLINRVWQSGDLRHGLICDLMIDGKLALCSDEAFRVALHSGYTELGVCGYDTQFLEQYDSRAAEVGFTAPDFDDSAWEYAAICQNDDHILVPQKSHMLTFEELDPVAVKQNGNRILYDFGSNYVGYLSLVASGKDGDCVILRCAQELNDDGTPRFKLRANCNYEEKWILRNGESTLDQFDYKAFRFAELEIPEGVEIIKATLLVRHAPFSLQATLKSEYASDPDLKRIWNLCVHTQRYGVQEVIQDCMEREKGFYLGDGCYTALTNLILTGDDSMVRKLIDDAFASSFITDTLVTCMDCSLMQEIGEYPLILVYLVLWHYRLCGDRSYLEQTYPKITALLDAYRREYERDGLLRDLDKWCVVDWPKNFQHDYAVDVTQGKVCAEAHVAINAYYLAAVRTANMVASILGELPYRDEAPLYTVFLNTFYDQEKHLFRDGETHDHISVLGNAFVYGFELYPDQACREKILALFDPHGIDKFSFFGAFALLMGFARDGDEHRLRHALKNNGAWLRMLREDATTTFESWSKDSKWNTSLFHLTMSYAAIFLAEIDQNKLFEGFGRSL